MKYKALPFCYVCNFFHCYYRSFLYSGKVGEADANADLVFYKWKHTKHKDHEQNKKLGNKINMT